MLQVRPLFTYITQLLHCYCLSVSVSFIVIISYFDKYFVSILFLSSTLYICLMLFLSYPLISTPSTILVSSHTVSMHNHTYISSYLWITVSIHHHTYVSDLIDAPTEVTVRHRMFVRVLPAGPAMTVKHQHARSVRTYALFSSRTSHLVSSSHFIPSHLSFSLFPLLLYISSLRSLPPLSHLLFIFFISYLLFKVVADTLTRQQLGTVYEDKGETHARILTAVTLTYNQTLTYSRIHMYSHYKSECDSQQLFCHFLLWFRPFL